MWSTFPPHGGRQEGSESCLYGISSAVASCARVACAADEGHAVTGEAGATVNARRFERFNEWHLCTIAVSRPARFATPTPGYVKTIPL
jgi:hypothetical protein